MTEKLKNSVPVNLIVAHGLEAKPLVRMLQLERDEASSDYVQYSSPNKLRLLVSGMGKESVAAAVTYLAEQQANDDGEIRAWLNVGIAGHRDAPLGSAWLGNKITDMRSTTSAYPPQLMEGIRSGRVVTVDEPENEYPLDAAYEMEASAFYAEATKYSTAELVQVYKVISDNLANPISEIDLGSVPGLIAEQESQLRKLINAMSGIVEQYNSYQQLPRYYHETCSQLRLTVNQKLQLKRLCQRYKAMGLEAELNAASVAGGVQPGQLIQNLRERLEHRSLA